MSVRRDGRRARCKSAPCRSSPYCYGCDFRGRAHSIRYPTVPACGQRSGGTARQFRPQRWWSQFAERSRCSGSARRGLRAQRGGKLWSSLHPPRPRVALASSQPSLCLRMGSAARSHPGGYVALRGFGRDRPRIGSGTRQSPRAACLRTERRVGDRHRPVPWHGCGHAQRSSGHAGLDAVGSDAERPHRRSREPGGRSGPRSRPSDRAVRSPGDLSRRVPPRPAGRTPVAVRGARRRPGRSRVRGARSVHPGSARQQERAWGPMRRRRALSLKSAPARRGQPSSRERPTGEHQRRQQ